MNNPKQICLHKLAGHRKEGFHFIIFKDGTILEALKIVAVPINSIGHNKDVIAIALEGDFIFEEVTLEQLNSSKVLLLKLCTAYNIDTTMHHIFTHCDYRDPPGDRSCPGKYLHRAVPGIAKEVYQAIKRGVK